MIYLQILSHLCLNLEMKIKNRYSQWFSNGLPWDSVRDAAHYHFYWVLYQLQQIEVPPGIDVADQWCREAEKIENTGLDKTKKIVFLLH